MGEVIPFDWIKLNFTSIYSMDTLFLTKFCEEPYYSCLELSKRENTYSYPPNLILNASR